MKLTKYSATLMVTAAMLVGCDSGGSANQPGEACYDLCDRYDECDIDVFDGQICKPICSEVEDLERELSDECNDAITDLFNCAVDKSCNELTDDINPAEIDSLITLLQAIFTDCEDEAEEVADQCEDELLP